MYTTDTRGAIAQLVEHVVYTDIVGGSSPSSLKDRCCFYHDMHLAYIYIVVYIHIRT